MANALMSNVEFHTAVYCYATLHTGERVEYDLVSRETKIFPGCDTTQHVMVKIRKRGCRTDPGGWYRMNALFFVMPDGSVRR